MPILTANFPGTTELQQRGQDLKQKLADALQQKLGDVLEEIKKEAYAITPYDPDNPHEGTENLKISSPQFHKGHAIAPSDLHIRRMSGQEDDTGHLRDASQVDVLYDEDEQKIYGQISYNSAYAAFQHEDFTLNHPHGGQAKFLEEPFLGHQGSMLEELGDGLLDDIS